MNEMAWTCPCGANNGDDLMVCRKCGRELFQSGQKFQAPYQQTNQTPPNYPLGIPGWQPPKRRSSAVLIVGGIVAVGLILIIGGIIAVGIDRTSSSTDNSASDVTAPLTLPAAEAEFISVVSTAQRGSPQAENDMQRGGIKATRDEGICRVLVPVFFRAQNWVGTVTKVDSNSDGKGILYISISKNIRVETWNNELSDTFDNTLLQPLTELFQTASLLKEGQLVSFSGSFIPEPEHCIRESSLTLGGKLDAPEFIFRFSSVASYNSIPTRREEKPAQLPPQTESVIQQPSNAIPDALPDSQVEPTTKPSANNATPRREFDISTLDKQRSASLPTPASNSCSEPVILYRPAPPDDRRGPPAYLVVTATIDETGRATDISFPSPPDFARGTSAPVAEAWTPEYEKMVADDMAQWKVQPSSCNGSPASKRATFYYSFHFRR